MRKLQARGPCLVNFRRTEPVGTLFALTCTLCRDCYVRVREQEPQWRSPAGCGGDGRDLIITKSISPFHHEKCESDVVYTKLVHSFTCFQEGFLSVVWHISACRVHIIHEDYMCVFMCIYTHVCVCV